MERFYLTTAIDYVNSRPHLGTAYEKVTADVIARYRRLCGVSTQFVMGNDEHSQNVFQRATELGLEPKVFCDQMEQVFREVWSKLDVSFDDFIRTTEERHRVAVNKLVQQIAEAGDLYEGQYEGWYCVSCEAFKQDKDLVDGECPVHRTKPEWIKEKNHFFRLAKYRDRLLDHYAENPGFLQPAVRRNEMLRLLERGLEDISVSRTGQRWGIPLPFDTSSVVYVWFDALSNYASIPAALGDAAAAGPIGLETQPDAPALWPADIHVIGKDILKFHAVYWPIMLKAMELPLPKQVLVHGWWQKDGQKMSKTTGNVVDPIAVIDEWGVDAFRYYAVRELDIGPDGNWTDESFQARYSAELANGLGNLVNRSLSMLNRYRNGTLETTSDELAADAEKWIAEARRNYEAHQIQAALVSVWGLVDRANQYVEQTAPFKLAKQEDQADRLNEVLYNLAEACRILAVLLWPVIPETAEKIFEQVGIDGSPANFDLAKWGGLAKGHTCQKPTPLFPRKDLEKK